jgi:hypothetical protein
LTGRRGHAARHGSCHRSPPALRRASGADAGRYGMPHRARLALGGFAEADIVMSPLARVRAPRRQDPGALGLIQRTAPASTVTPGFDHPRRALVKHFSPQCDVLRHPTCRPMAACDAHRQCQNSVSLYKSYTYDLARSLLISRHETTPQPLPQIDANARATL